MKQEELTELYRKYRPTDDQEVRGQDQAMAILKKKKQANELPHAILLHGPFGTGKTTIARRVADWLQCSEHDLQEMNTADYRGIDSVREIRTTMGQAPINGPVRVWILDEVHKATNDAQNALLKILEDPKRHTYFILCTTEVERLLKGIRQRCLELKLNPIPDNDMYQIIKRICVAEKIRLSKPVVKKLIECSEGSARQALQSLDRVFLLEDEQEQLDAIEKTSVKRATIEIARLLLNTKTRWSHIAPLLLELKNEDPESIRWMILGYAQAVLLKTTNPRAFRMIEAFRENFYDCKFSGVVAACYELLQ